MNLVAPTVIRTSVVIATSFSNASTIVEVMAEGAEFAQLPLTQLRDVFMTFMLHARFRVIALDAVILKT